MRTSRSQVAIADSSSAGTQLTYGESKINRVSARCGIDFAYRDIGRSGIPLVLLQHFRGNLDNWDPALIDALAARRRVIAFDNAGVGRSSGLTPNSIEAMAHDAIAFVEALRLDCVDLLGFSIGSFVAQEIALIRPGLVRRIVLASGAPRGAPGIHGWGAPVIDAIGGREGNAEGYLKVFFTDSEGSRKAGLQALTRMQHQSGESDEPTSWQTRLAQYDAVCSWGIPNHADLQRLSGIDHRVFVANGDRDPMIPPRYSHLLAGLLPNAHIKIYPDAAHGFLFQHHLAFASDVNGFLDRG